MKKSTSVAALSTLLAVTLVGTASADTVISSPTIQYSDGSPVVEIVDRDGTGALYIDTPTGADKAQVAVTAGDGTLGDLRSLSYRTYKEAGSGQQVASLNITVAPWAGTFVYEPVYDTSADLVTGEWQTWDAFSSTARWWNSDAAGQFVTWDEIIAGYEDHAVAVVMVNQGTGNAALRSYVDWVEVDGQTFDFGPVVHDPSAITAPTAGQDLEVGEELRLRAHDTSAAAGGVSWAVRAGTCAVGTGTVAGNVDGFRDASSWSDGLFAADLATVGWEVGTYCFVFNPAQGDRLAVTFDLVAVPVPPVALDGKDECKRGGWERSESPVFSNQGDCVSHFASDR